MLNRLQGILKRLQSGRISLKEATNRLKYLPFEDIGFAKVDTHRSLRRGYPEVIYGESKTIDEIIKIASVLYQAEKRVIITRLDRKKSRQLKKKFPRGKYFTEARIFFIGPKGTNKGGPLIGVISGGTGDRPVAEEAAIICEIFGLKVLRIYDAGAAGIHRLLAHHRLIDKCKVLIVIAGMDGVLPSVVGGLVGKPIIAVPTSVGYGASFHGLAPLLTMLNSCAPGVVVVNVDNGFGAGYFASLINSL